MRTWKKVLAFVLALTMVIGIAVPSSFAIGTEKVTTTGTFTTEEVTKTKPDKTTVNIYKVKADSFYGSKVPAEHNLGQLTKDQLAGLGSKVDFLAGVKFTYYTVKKEQFDVLMADPGSYKTAAQVDAKYPGLTKVTTKATDTNGLVSVELAEGYYWFVEDSYTPPKDSTSSISSSIALPFGLSLPYTNPKDITIGNDTYPAGTSYLKTIYIYPKNVVGDEPVVEKDVKELGHKTATYNVGDPHPWAIHTTVPANIKDYTKFIISDTIDTRLDYVGKVVVAYGNYKDMAAVKAAATGVKLEEGKDYTLTEPAENAAGGQLEVALTKAGIKKLGEKYNADSKLYVYFETKINSTATMGKPIPNDVTLTFNNGQGDDKHKNPDNPPVVITGGKRFVKIDASNPDIKLLGAVFELLDNKIEGKDKAIKWTQALLDANAEAIKAGKFATNANGTASSDTNKPKVDDPIRMLSNKDGQFEIKGLELTNGYKVEYKKDNDGKVIRPLEIESITEDTTAAHEYQIKEIKAPENYALASDPISFTITHTSYGNNPLGIKYNETNKEPKDAKEMQVKDTKLTIPQTGGMGTVLFTVVGLALMGGAFVAFRKNKKAYEEAE